MWEIGEAAGEAKTCGGGSVEGPGTGAAGDWAAAVGD